MDSGKARSMNKLTGVSIDENILFSFFEMLKHIRNSMKTVSPKMVTDCIYVSCSYTEKAQILIYATFEFWQDLIRNNNFMTISIFALRGELNGKIYTGAFLSGIFKCFTRFYYFEVKPFQDSNLTQLCDVY